jgi:hypothetical protein
MAQDPLDKSTIYYASQFLHKSTNKGASWETISPDLTTNDSVKIDQSNNGGLSLDITGAENFCTILTIAPSPKEKGIIWVGTDDGNVQLTKDGGKTWTSFRGKIPGMPLGAWIPQIRASVYNAGEAYVICNDYRRGDFKPYIFYTSDFGKTWKRLVDEKKVNGYALCLIQDPTEPNLIFVGTEHGMWVSLDKGESFQQWKNGYPSVSTYDFAIQEREADLAIATFGRALWVLDDIRPLRELAKNKGTLQVAKKLTTFPTKDAYLAEFRNAPGYEWSTWGIWDAANRPAGAAISYYVQPTVGDTSTKSKTDSVAVKIYDLKNELIRTLKWKADTGFNRNNWTLEKKGIRMPGSPRQRGRSAEPGGRPVIPGIYKLVIALDKATDSVMVTVKPDPRLGDRTAIVVAQDALYNRLQKTSDKLTTGLDRLTEIEEAARKMEGQLKDVEGKPADTLRKATKVLQDSVKVIREMISGKKLERQGYGRPQEITILNYLMTANGAIGAKPIVPGAQEVALVAIAEDKVNLAVSRINAFIENSWKNYKQLAENTKLDLFKNYTPIQ